MTGSMDDPVRLDAWQCDRLAEILQGATGTVLLAVDDIDRAVKVKVDGRWSPPIGHVAPPAPSTGWSNRDDLNAERRDLGTRPSDVARAILAEVDPSEWRDPR